MATALEARTQLSKDLGDFFESTTTGAGSTTTLVDDAIGDWDEDSFFLNRRRTTIYMQGAGEERRVDPDTGITTSNTLTVTRAFTSGTGSGNTWELHRLFTAAQKDEAITVALDLIWPKMFLPIHYSFSTVAEQMDYDISSAGFHNDVVRQVQQESTADSEHWVDLFNWEMRVNDSSGTKELHFLEQPSAVRTIHTFGHKKMALSDYTDGEDLLALCAQAAVYLLETELARSDGTERNWISSLLQLSQQRLRDRIQQYRRKSISYTSTTQMVGRRNFSVHDVP